MRVKVTNMESPRTGNPVANQFIIDVGEKEYFQSYRSVIAVRDRSKYPSTVTLDETYWDYSVTTLKYLKEFLGTYDSKKDIQKKIDSGEIKTANLN